MKKSMNVGIVGLGDISGIYLQNIVERYHQLKVVAVCDILYERALAVKEKYGIPAAYQNVEELVNDSAVEIVLNLTRPVDHFNVTMAALHAGKHVYTEKPLGVSFEEGKQMVAAAEAKGLYLGVSPDTFLGAGLQTCRSAIDAGLIGQPIGANARMINRGHESWHSNPDYYYQHGGGPLLDMGPYYITALVSLFGEVEKVSGFAKKTFQTRTITSQPRAGQTIQVDVPTWISANLQFKNGATAQLFTTFDVVYHQEATLELYGSETTIIAPNPDFFDGPVQIYDKEKEAYVQLDMPFDFDGNARGLGLADMAQAIMEGRPNRASAAQGLHVLEIMDKIGESAKLEKTLAVETSYERPAPMPKKGEIK